MFRLRVHRDAVRRREAAGRGLIGRAPAGEETAVAVEHADPPVPRLGDGAVALRGLALVPPQLRDVGAPLRIEHEVRRPLGVGPLREVLAVGAEDLDAIVLPVADEDAPVRGGRDPVRQDELAGPLAGHAPRALQVPARGELVHAAVAVAVGDVEIALRAHREVRRAVEGDAGARHRHGVLAVVAGVGRLVHGAEREQQLALRGELPHRVVAVVGAVDAAVRADGDAVGPVGELALAPRGEELARVVVDHDRVVAATDQEDAVLRVHRHARHVAVLVALGELLPALDDLVRQRVRPRHGPPPGECTSMESIPSRQTMGERFDRVKARPAASARHPRGV